MEMKVGQNVGIDLPAGEIFAYVAEFENLADWSGTVIAVRKSPSGAIHVGTTVLITIRFLGKWVQSTYEVVECEPGHHITLKSIAGIAPSSAAPRISSSSGMASGARNAQRHNTVTLEKLICL